MATEAVVSFNRVSQVGTESRYIAEAYQALHLCGDGPFTRRCHAVLEAEFGVGKAFLTTSCTHALEMSALLLDIEPGDEVILPTFTFPSLANAFVLRGAKPVFADIRPDTLNLDERQLPDLISSATKAILPMHYAGVGCEMDTICEIAGKRGIAIVEDNAHGIFGRYRGRALGTFGSMSTLSFHETKNFSCGEGGALLVNSPELVERAEIIREKGTNRKKYFRGEVDKYTWVGSGSSYLLAEILAAVLFAQLEVRNEMQQRRRACWLAYEEGLSDWAAACGVGLPYVPAECEQSHHIFYLLLDSLEARTVLIEHLRANGVQSVFHYVPLHRSSMGERFGGHAGQCPVAESTSERLVRLPLYSDLSEAEQMRVIRAVRSSKLPSRRFTARERRTTTYPYTA